MIRFYILFIFLFVSFPVISDGVSIPSDLGSKFSKIIEGQLRLDGEDLPANEHIYNMFKFDQYAGVPSLDKRIASNDFYITSGPPPKNSELSSVELIRLVVPVITMPGINTIDVNDSVKKRCKTRNISNNGAAYFNIPQPETYSVRSYVMSFQCYLTLGH